MLKSVRINTNMNQITKSNKETIEFGKELAQKLIGGDILLLNGDLGAGKTTLVKGLAAGLDVTEEITSPTFTLMNVYDSKNKLKLVHIDTYRLKNQEELLEIGVEDYLGEKNIICVIEWPEKIKGLLKNKKTISVDIEHVDENSRKITTN